MFAALRRWLRARRETRTREHDGVPRGSGWDRLGNDPTFDFTQRMAESLGSEPPRVRRRRR